MAAVVVDTDVASFIFKRDSRAIPFRRRLLGHTLIISFMTLAELRVWPRLHNWGAARLESLERHLRRYTVYFPDEAMCDRWAEVSATARKRGNPIDVADAWIAATALALGVPLITNNAEHFARIENLKVLAEET